MTALALQTGAINLSQGFPDYPIDPELAGLLAEAAEAGYNQYAPMSGLPMIREAIAADISRRYGLKVDEANEITITPGATYGIYTAFAAILQPGDEVFVLEPACDSYIPNIEMAGARAVPVPLTAPHFTVDWQRVADAISIRTKAIIINTPHNPTGSLWSQEDWDQLAGLVRDTEIIVISDEVYEQLTFDGRTHISVLSHEELKQRSVAVYSFGKVYSNTGWKLGYVVAPPAITDAFRNVHQYLAFSVNSTAQYAIAKYLGKERKEEPSAAMQARRDLLLELLADLPFTIYAPSSGSYFQLAGYDRISDLSDRDFAIWLTKTYGVATIPVSPFYSDGRDDRLVRFCFSKKEETLREAARRLAEIRV
jgi:methionine aminotransferase